MLSLLSCWKIWRFISHIDGGHIIRYIRYITFTHIVSYNIIYTCITFHNYHDFISPQLFPPQALVQQPGHRLPQRHHILKFFAERQVQPALHREPAGVVQMAFPNALLTWKVTPVMSGIFGGLLPRIIQDHTRSSQDRSLKMCWCCEVFGIWEGFLRGSVKPSIVKLFPPLSMRSLTNLQSNRSAGQHQKIYWTVFGFALSACKCHSCKNFSCHSVFCTTARAHVINCSVNNACKRTNARSNGWFCMHPYACRVNSLVGTCSERFHWKQGLHIYWWMTGGRMDGRHGSTVCFEKASAQCHSPAIQSWITVMRGDCLSHAHFFGINSHRQYCIRRFGWQKKTDHFIPLPRCNSPDVQEHPSSRRHRRPVSGRNDHGACILRHVRGMQRICLPAPLFQCLCFELFYIRGSYQVLTGFL